MCLHGRVNLRDGVDAVAWLSGDHVWLLDVIAGDAHQATSVLANFRQLAGDRPIKIAPLVGRLIEPDVLAKLRVAPTDVAVPT